MKPLNKTEIAIVRISFTLDPTVKVTNGAPIDNVLQVNDWYKRTIREEKNKIDDTSKLRHSKWRIISRDPEIFTVDDYQFQNIVLVLAEDTKHWVFYDNDTDRRVEGKGKLSLVYCPCCLYKHYDRVMDSIKLSMLENQQTHQFESEA